MYRLRKLTAWLIPQEVPRTGAFEEQRWDKKGASRRADVVGALRSGLDRLAEVSTSALQRVGSSDLLHRFWTCLEVAIHSSPHLYSSGSHPLVILFDGI